MMGQEAEVGVLLAMVDVDLEADLVVRPASS